MPEPATLSERLASVVRFGLAPWSIDVQGEYLPWDTFRHKETPGSVSPEDWWLATRIARHSNERRLAGLLDKDGRPFSFLLPDQVLRATENIASNASGAIGISELVTNPDTKNRYLVNSLIEEAITSSQLEGAATTRIVAKDMLRTGREPRTTGEQMIWNNYAAMQYIRELVDQPLTPALIKEIHGIVTAGTLENPEYSGRLQDDQSMRVSVRDEEDELLHAPPPVDELPERIKALCAFANDEAGDPYMPPVLRAITIHFMVGYDHYFEDGNGRTARALFYWSMLRQGYWLTEYLSISRILHRAPAKYARSFLLTEQDEGDLTHFFIYHLGVIERSIEELHNYLASKVEEVRNLQGLLRRMPDEFNHRQLAILDHAVRNPLAQFTIQSHRSSHRVSVETARQDLRGLADRGLLTQFKIGRRFYWEPVAHIESFLSADPS